MEKRIAGVWPWFIQRVTAAFLLVGMIIHFWVLHYYLEKPLNFEKVVARMRSPGWILFDLLLLAAVVYHGLNGIWSIMTDWKMSAKSKKAWGWILSIIGITTFIVGVYILIPFKG